MKRYKPLLGILFLEFALLTAWALSKVGYLGIWQAGLATPGGMQILADLVICCGLVSSWMVGDARSRGLNPWPWVAGTLFGGSLAVLLYLLVRPEKPP